VHIKEPNMRKTTVTRSKGATSVLLSSLAVFSVNTTKKGGVKSIREYADMTTGEIIPAEELTIPTLDLRTKQAEREAALNSLRPEVRAFAYFVLKFANKRRGITPGIDTLVRWYADLHARQAQHVRRHLPKLTEVGLLAGESLLGPLFQQTGGSARAHLSEETYASEVYARMRRNDFDPASCKGQMCDPAALAQEVSRLDADLAVDTAYWNFLRNVGAMESGQRAVPCPA